MNSFTSHCFVIWSTKETETMPLNVHRPSWGNMRPPPESPLHGPEPLAPEIVINQHINLPIMIINWQKSDFYVFWTHFLQGKKSKLYFEVLMGSASIVLNCLGIIFSCFYVAEFVLLSFNYSPKVNLFAI